MSHVDYKLKDEEYIWVNFKEELKNLRTRIPQTRWLPKSVVPSNRRISSEKEISDYVLGKFFRCFKPFYSWMKKGESYWFEYQGNGTYCVRSDNNLGKIFSMEVHQLLTCFIPCGCEEDDAELIRYFHWLGELGEHYGYVDDYIKYKEIDETIEA